ncbi:unnamed protein product [Arctogadus glacialis]
MSEDAIPSTSTAPMTSMALPTTLTTEIEDEEPVVADIVEDQTVGDCIQEEGLFYVAGWLVRVLQKEEIVQACPHCEVLLLGARHQDHSYATSEDHPFLEAKKYTATANLMRPSEGFFRCHPAFGGGIWTEHRRFLASHTDHQKNGEGSGQSGGVQKPLQLTP